MSNNSNVNIPKEIDSVNVTTIAPQAFAYSQNIETITLPDTINGVGAYAFSECNSLKKVVFSDNDVTIGKDIFSNSPNAVICAPNDSYAQKYAAANNIVFEGIN